MQSSTVQVQDYGGSGASAPASLRGFCADLFDWTRDHEAVIDAAHTALPAQPMYLLGHSLGAQLPGLPRNQHKVSGLLGAAAQAHRAVLFRAENSERTWPWLAQLLAGLNPGANHG